MVMNSHMDSKTDDLARQVDILRQEIKLVNKRIDLNVATETNKEQIASALANALKNQLSTQLKSESSTTKLQPSDLTGINNVQGNSEFPSGKSGTFKIAAGTAGTVLLRSKVPMLRLLKDIAEEINTDLHEGGVIVNETQLDQACQAEFTLRRILYQTEKLRDAIQKARPEDTKVRATMLVPALAPTISAVYSLGIVLDSINSLGKLFRIDREVDIFPTDAEATQVLCYMLDSKESIVFANRAITGDNAAKKADSILDNLNALLVEVNIGNDLLAELNEIKKKEANIHSDPSRTRLPKEEFIDGLKLELDIAKSLLDGLDPYKKPDVFWTLIKGQLISEALVARDRILLEIKAQALQVTESRWYWSDRIRLGGEVQVSYRVLDRAGKLKKTRVILRTSELEKANIDKVLNFEFRGL